MRHAGEFAVITGVFLIAAGCGPDSQTEKAAPEHAPHSASPANPEAASHDSETNGMVSVTFDDGYASQYAEALPLLKKHNIAPTLFFISDTLLRNGKYAPDYMSAQQAKDFVGQLPETEVGAHTVHHCDLVASPDAQVYSDSCSADITDEQVKSEIVDGKNDLEQLFGRKVTAFATPYGSYKQKTIRYIAEAGFNSHRTSDSGFNDAADFNPYKIKVQNVLNTTTPDQVEKWVEHAEQKDDWLVLEMHKVEDTEDEFSITPENLDKVLTGIDESDVAVKTISEAVKVMKTETGSSK